VRSRLYSKVDIEKKHSPLWKILFKMQKTSQGLKLLNCVFCTVQERWRKVSRRVRAVALQTNGTLEGGVKEGDLGAVTYSQVSAPFARSLCTKCAIVRFIAGATR
jgi:hypothetical protein